MKPKVKKIIIIKKNNANLPHIISKLRTIVYVLFIMFKIPAKSDFDGYY